MHFKPLIFTVNIVTRSCRSIPMMNAFFKMTLHVSRQRGELYVDLVCEAWWVWKLKAFLGHVQKYFTSPFQPWLKTLGYLLKLVQKSKPSFDVGSFNLESTSLWEPVDSIVSGVTLTSDEDTSPWKLVETKPLRCKYWTPEQNPTPHNDKYLPVDRLRKQTY